MRLEIAQVQLGVILHFVRGKAEAGLVQLRLSAGCAEPPRRRHRRGRRAAPHDALLLRGRVQPRHLARPAATYEATELP